ncbi:HPr family phosphocarrier protein [Salibacterium salarium]|uniref:HPr family phosphocarrier protein n=1 Tax=Salibacterium salarium TaxID=284579 RepID=A0A3R9P6P6_9BACI|nr:HPr family phosphocarrier protein [Salibacterium salarium]RSL33958.1 HPr family phosphocarrier protein [Salibacterium salarium]
MQKEIQIHISENQTITELSQLLTPYNAEVYLEKKDDSHVIEVNLKSFLGLITMRLQNGDNVIIRTEGTDAQESLKAVSDYLT